MTSNFEDEVAAFMKASKADVSQNRQAIQGNIQGMQAINATMEEVLAQVKLLTAERGAAPDAAVAAAGVAVAAEGGQGTPGQLDAGDWPHVQAACCLLYTSPSPRDATLSRMPSSA